MQQEQTGKFNEKNLKYWINKRTKKLIYWVFQTVENKRSPKAI